MIAGEPALTVRVTFAVPNFVLSATLVAVTVTVCWLLMDDGAIYAADWPLGLSVPTWGWIDHVTPVLLLPVTVAVNV